MNERIGQEEYLYKGMLCCLNPCAVQECPEPICALDFPGGLNAYVRCKGVLDRLRGGADIDEIAEELGIRPYLAKRLYKKSMIILAKVV